MIVVFIIDLSGITNTIKRMISNLLTKKKITTDNYSLPLLGCSLCITFWSGLLYLVIIQQFNIVMISIVCLLSYITPVTKDVLLSIKEFLIKWVNKIC